MVRRRRLVSHRLFVVLCGILRRLQVSFYSWKFPGGKLSHRSLSDIFGSRLYIMQSPVIWLIHDKREKEHHIILTHCGN